MRDGDEDGGPCHQLTAGLTDKSMWTSSTSTSNICLAGFCFVFFFTVIKNSKVNWCIYVMSYNRVLNGTYDH